MTFNGFRPQFFLLCSVLFAAPCFAEPTQTFKTFIAASNNGRTPNLIPEEHFDCSDMVYAVIKSGDTLNHAATQHELVVNWFNPANKLEQNTHYGFTAIGKDTFIWAWLRLSAPAGAAFGRIFDPAFGMGEFIGKWRVEILIDDDKIATHHFNVLC